MSPEDMGQLDGALHGLVFLEGRKPGNLNSGCHSSTLLLSQWIFSFHNTWENGGPFSMLL